MMPRKARAIILYDDLKFGLLTVIYFLDKMNELTMPSIPPYANALEGYPLSGMYNLQRI